MNSHTAVVSRRIGATVSALLLSLMSVFVALPAQAASVPQATVTLNSASADTGLDMTVSGTGFTGLPAASTGSPAMGFYVVVYDANVTSYADINENQSGLSTDWIMPSDVQDGTFSKDVTIAADQLDPESDLRAVMWSAHGTLTDATLITEVPITLSDEEHSALFPVEEPVQPQPAPETTVTVTGANKSAGLTLSVAGNGYVNLPNSSTGRPAAGVYTTVYDANTMTYGELNANRGGLKTDYVTPARITNGSFTSDLNITTAQFTEDADLRIAVWVAHGTITDETLIADIPVTLTPQQLASLFPADVEEPEEPEVPVDPEVPATERTTSIKVTGANKTDGLTLAISGSQYVNLPKASTGKDAVGVYVALRDKSDSYDDINADTSIATALSFVYFRPTGTPGVFNTTLNTSAKDLDPNADYEVFVWAAHGNITDETLLYAGDLTLSADQKAALFSGGGNEEPVEPGPVDPDPTRLKTKVAVTKSSVADGLVLNVTGTGYVDLPKNSTGGPANGVYVALYDANTMTYADINKDLDALALDWVMPGRMSNGSFTSTLTTKAGDLSKNPDLRIVVWSAHGLLTDGSFVTEVPVKLSADQLRALGLLSASGTDVTASVGKSHIDLAGDRSQTATASGFEPGEKVKISLHSKVVNLGTKTADKNGTVSISFNVPKDSKPGTHAVVFQGLSSGVQARAEFTVTDLSSSGNSAGTGGSGSKGTATLPTTSDIARKGEITCTTETIPGSPGQVSLSWGVRSSFVSYIEGGIAKGSVTTGGGAYRSGNGFSWGTGSGSLNASGIGTVSFPGSVRFTGHGGLLDLAISNVQVRSTGGNSGSLVAHVRSTDMEGNVVANGTVTIGTVSFSSLGANGGTGSVTLTSEGARAFAGFYGAGEALDNLTLSVSGALPEQTVETCYDEDGNRVNADGSAYTGGQLPVTGTNSAGLIGMAGALLLVGTLLTIRRTGTRTE
ncbi:HtaA domain-containing protein [Flaviflexus massiliensis]|uniref:HtaA domain-containing protein n=1 Tax=Flaviflexus massiliensis TaxID=1522309 RepID=UPI0006D57C84|nr:HtaA domain-containing protein [Flaviflexus massiliensis]